MRVMARSGIVTVGLGPEFNGLGLKSYGLEILVLVTSLRNVYHPSNKSFQRVIESVNVFKMSPMNALRIVYNELRHPQHDV